MINIPIKEFVSHLLESGFRAERNKNNVVLNGDWRVSILIENSIIIVEYTLLKHRSEASNNVVVFELDGGNIVDKYLYNEFYYNEFLHLLGVDESLFSSDEL